MFLVLLVYVAIMVLFRCCTFSIVKSILLEYRRPIIIANSQTNISLKPLHKMNWMLTLLIFFLHLNDWYETQKYLAFHIKIINQYSLLVSLGRSQLIDHSSNSIKINRIAHWPYTHKSTFNYLLLNEHLACFRHFVGWLDVLRIRGVWLLRKRLLILMRIMRSRLHQSIRN